MSHNINFVHDATYTKNHVLALISCLKGYRHIEDIRESLQDIVETLMNGYPVITGNSRIGGDVTGPVWLHDCILHGGAIYGCGGIVIPTGAVVGNGSVIHLRGGTIVENEQQLKCLVTSKPKGHLAAR